jgi:hypothetical protein
MKKQANAQNSETCNFTKFNFEILEKIRVPRSNVNFKCYYASMACLPFLSKMAYVAAWS